MLEILNPLRDISFATVALRMVLAVVCGGIIGAEREFKRRPAGFRTHIIICLGACMTTLTSQYMALVLGYFTDLARLGAQVIAGVGFIGAGTIIVTKRQRVKGLTTAAGLWCSAIIGLALGGGFYEGGVLTTLLIMLAELVFANWEYKLLNSAPEVNLYIEYQGKGTLEQVLKIIHECEIKLLDLEITRKATAEEKTTCAIFALRLSKKFSSNYILEQFSKVQGILVIEEM